MSGTSQNRDLVAIEELSRLTDLRDDRGHYGPHDYVAVTPSRDADTHARLLATSSLRPLAEALEQFPMNIDISDLAERKASPDDRGTKLLKARVRVDGTSVPVDVDDSAFTLGLPLTLSLTPNLLEVALHLIAKRLHPELAESRSLRVKLGVRLLRQEGRLWTLASDNGGPSPVMPFATRVRGLRWWWEPQTGNDPKTTICIRCGREMTSRALIRGGVPYCRNCAKRRHLKLDHAIAPAEQGTWWIRCQHPDCTHTFVGRAQARYCPRHRSNRTTSRRRRSAST